MLDGDTAKKGDSGSLRVLSCATLAHQTSRQNTHGSLLVPLSRSPFSHLRKGVSVAIEHPTNGPSDPCASTGASDPAEAGAAGDWRRWDRADGGSRSLGSTGAVENS